MQIPLPFRVLGFVVALFLLLPSLSFAAAPTNEELLQKIDALQSEIDSLKQQIQSVDDGAKAAKKAAEEGLKHLDIATAEKAAELEQSPMAKARSFFEKAEIHGFASAAYLFNFNTPNDSNNPIRVFDFKHNSFNLDGAEIVFKKDVSGPGEVGFRTDLSAGFAIPEVVHATDVANGLDQPENFDLQQAYVTYDVPVGNGIVFDAGKFITHMGYEVIEGYDAFNDNYSRSILFGWAIPFTHTGIRATYNFTEHMYWMVSVSNGWDLVRDNNKGKTVGTQLAFDLTDQIRCYLNYVVGPEQEDDSNDIRHVGDICVVYNPDDHWTFGVNGTLGFEQDVDQFGTISIVETTIVDDIAIVEATEIPVLEGEEDATWGGVAGYARYQFNDWLAFILRSEFFIDEDGARTGAEQDLWEITATVEAKVGNNFVIRPEYRYDHSDIDFFDGEHNQNTLALNGIYYF